MTTDRLALANHRIVTYWSLKEVGCERLSVWMCGYFTRWRYELDCSGWQWSS